MLVSNLKYNSQKRYEEEEIIIDNEIKTIKADKEDYINLQEHKQIVIETNEGVDSLAAQELKEQLQKELGCKVKVIHHQNQKNKNEHYHLHILSNAKINNQKIYKIVNDFIKKGNEMTTTTTTARVFDNSKKNEYTLTPEQQEALKKLNEDSFSFIKKDSKTHNVEALEGYKKEGSKNSTGLGKLDRPTYILNGVSNEKAKLLSRFGIGLIVNNVIEIDKEKVKEILKEIIKEDLKIELEEDFDKYLNLEIEQNENEVSINFNNLIVLKNGKIGSLSKNLLEEQLSKILNNSIKNDNIIIENEDRLKPKEKVLEEINYKNNDKNNDKKEEVKTKISNKETIKEENKTEDKHINFYNELKQSNNEDFEKEIKKLKEAEIKINEIKDVLGSEIVENKLKEIKEKLEVIEIVKEEQEDKEQLNNKIKALEDKLKTEQEEKNKVIKNNINLQKELKTEQEDKEKIKKEYKDFEEKSKTVYKLLEQEKEELYNKYKEEREINRTLQKEIENKDSIIKKLNNTIKEQSEKITQVLKENETLKKAKEELNNKVNSFIEKLKEAKDYITNKEEENNKLIETLKEAKEYIEALEEEEVEQKQTKNKKRTLPKSPK